MPIASLSDIDIHYEIIGQGEPLLLVSGLGGAASYWAPNVEALAKHYQVILHDHRGTGRSTRYEGGYTVEMLADDLLRLMDHLGIARAHLVGHSTGGAIGQVMAARAPERIASLVLYASWAVLDPQMEMCLAARRRILLTSGMEDYYRANPIFLLPPVYNCDNADVIEAEIAAGIASSPPVSILEARISGIMAFDGRPYLDAVACPTLVLVAQDDILTPPYSSQMLAASIKGAELLQVPYGAHAYSRVLPAAFNNDVLRFLDGHAMTDEVSHVHD